MRMPPGFIGRTLVAVRRKIGGEGKGKEAGLETPAPFLFVGLLHHATPKIKASHVPKYSGRSKSID
jgi:hypothetical protein